MLIHFTSNHPAEYKIAAFWFLVATKHQLPSTPRNKQKECYTILNIGKTNGFQVSLLKKLNTAMFHRTPSPLTPNTHNTTHKLWETFKFHGLLIRKLIHLLRNTSLKITFRSTNTNRIILRIRTDNSVTKHQVGM
jgi:hypothetical protein